MKSHTLILSLIALLLIVSCSKNEYLDATIDQPTVEFSSLTINKTISFSENSTYNIAVPLQIFGGTSDKPIAIQAKTDLSSDKYSVATSKTLNNTALDTIYVGINTQNIQKGKTYTIELSLSANDVSISENYKTCLITFSQETFMDFFTGTYSCKESATNSVYEVLFEKQNDSSIKNNNFWDFPLNGQYVTYEFTQDDSHSVKIADDTEWIDFLGNKYLISGSGTYELNGNFVVAYEMKDATTKNTYQTGTHTFIKK